MYIIKDLATNMYFKDYNYYKNDKYTEELYNNCFTDRVGLAYQFISKNAIKKTIKEDDKSLFTSGLLTIIKII